MCKAHKEIITVSLVLKYSMLNTAESLVITQRSLMDRAIEVKVEVVLIQLMFHQNIEVNATKQTEWCVHVLAKELI